MYASMSAQANSSKQPAAPSTPMQPVTQPASPRSNAHREHAARLAREQQQMIEELMSTGLAQASDLVALGFTEAEIAAAGFHVPAPHHAAEEEKAVAAVVAVTSACAEEEVGSSSSSGGTEARRGKARKRGWQDEPRDFCPATSSTATDVFGSASRAREPKTAVKTIEVAAGRPTSLSEQRRTTALQAAYIVDEYRGQRHVMAGVAEDACARALHYDDEDEESEGSGDAKVVPAPTFFAAPSTSSLTSQGLFSAAAHPPRRVNTALNFSGTDVAVVKEMAQLLRAPADEEERLERLRVQEYLESREDGNGAYM